MTQTAFACLLPFTTAETKLLFLHICHKGCNHFADEEKHQKIILAKSHRVELFIPSTWEHVKYEL
jgi:hypothetical protein